MTTSTDYAPRPLLQSIIGSAVEATAATSGWLAMVVDDRELAIVAAASTDAAAVPALLWQRTALGSGTASFVVQSGQPVAMQPGAGAGDDWSQALLGRPAQSLVCVPCLADEMPVGALQLVDKQGGGAFDFDDVELATLLGQIAGEALAEGSGASTVSTPEQIAGELSRLATNDPARYAALARAIAALLGVA